MAGNGEPLNGAGGGPPDERGGPGGAVAPTIDPPSAPGEASAVPDTPPARWTAPPLARTVARPGPAWLLPGRGRVVIVAGLVVAALGLVLPVLIVATLGGPLGGVSSFASSTSCPPSALDPTLPADLGAPGQLGGIAGTGITQADFDAVSRSPYASSLITPGEYVSTAYGPPWGGIQGNGDQTAGGLQIHRGSPQKYFVAVDPKLIGHGTWVYIWPNPFNWAGPFLAADTGGAIRERRIDFYDWRGRTTQYGWGRQFVRASATPLVPAAGGQPSAAPTGSPSSTVPAAATTTPAVCDGAAPVAATGTPIDAGAGWGGVAGTVQVLPGANAPGRPLLAPILAFVGGLAGHAGRTIVISTGTNHTKYSLSGFISDHWYGLAADLGASANGFTIGGDGGTLIAAAALVTAGVPAASAQAIAAGGGVHNVCSQAPDGTIWRVQVLWKTYTGGNHYNHVHVGIKQGCTFKGVQSSP